MMRNLVSMLLVFFTACGASTSDKPNPDPDTSTADTASDVGLDLVEPDAAGAIPLRFETFDRPDYNPLVVQSGEDLELTSGFQGGWMFDLMVIREPDTPNRLNGEYHWVVRKDGVSLLDTRQPADPGGWTNHDSGDVMFRLYQEPLDIVTTDEVVGSTVQIEVTIEHADGSVSYGELQVNVVDTYDEITGG